MFGIGNEVNQALSTYEAPKPIAQLVGGVTTALLGQAARVYIAGTLGAVLGWPLLVVGALGAAHGVTRVASQLLDRP